MEIDENTKNEERLSIKMIFILFGVASLIGWNALLTEIDFFNVYLPEMKPAVSFSFLNYILNLLLLILMIWKKDLISLKVQLIGGIVGSIALLILIPLSAILLGKNTLINKIITGGLVVIMGGINALCQGGFFNFISYFPLTMLVLFSAGQGISGIGLNIIQYIVLATTKSIKAPIQIIIQGMIFFGFSCLILIISLIIYFKVIKQDYFIYYLNPKKNGKKIEALMQDENQEEIGEGTYSITEVEPEIGFFELFKKIWDLSVIMAYIYIITFSVFPNVSLAQKMFQIPNDYRVNTIISIFNLFDTIGRYSVEKIKPTKKLNSIINFGRTILCFTFIINYYCQQKAGWNLTLTSILLILNVSLLGFTNGVGTTICFGLAPEQVPDQYKGQVGTAISFFINVGIFIGTCVAFGTDEIIDLISGK